jgi:uncharacterized LabA/DUF88 family protein
MDTSPRRILIVDGAHYDRLRTTFGTGLDFTKLVAFLSEDGAMTHCHYHRDLRDREEAGRQAPLLNWLSDHGFTVIGHPVPAGSSLRKERYGTNLVAVAVDAMATCRPRDELYLLAGDIKLSPVVAELTSRGVSVTLVSTLSAPPSFAPQPELLEHADKFIDLNDYLADLAMN